MAGHDWTFHIDPLGQSAGLWNLYTQLTFVYAVPHTSVRDSIVAILTEGLRQLTSSFPWVAGQVVRECRGDGAEQYVVKSFESIPQLNVEDLSHLLPSFDTFKARNFPINLLDEDLVAPRKTKSVSTEDDPKPVFLIQATFITGGLLLTFAAQHGTMDIVGEAEVIRLLSKACHDVPFTSEELSLGNQDRRTVVALLDDAEMQGCADDKQPDQNSEVELGASTETKLGSVSEPPPPPPHNVWSNFVVSSASLSTLKQSAISSTTLTSGFISTDDALSAFVWQCMTRARRPHLAATDTTTFARTVDVRRFVDVAPTYPGNLATKTFTTYTVDKLIQEPLGAIASEFRLAIDPEKSRIGHRTRAAATALVRGLPNPERKRSRDLSRDVAFSSWSKVNYCWDLDFNLGLGTPASVRRPAFAPPNEQPMEGVVYLLPRRGDGEIAVTICMIDEDMERLRADQEWGRFATYVG